MSTFLIVLLVLVLVLHAYRQYWTHRALPQASSGSWDGQMYKVGETYILHRAAQNDSGKTIICFPGFLEDMRYFQALHEQTKCELILVNNANYHCPFPGLPVTQLDWPSNPHRLGSIEHDGFYLAHTLEKLASGSHCILHGHSRGGAVVLDAGRQFPELMQRDSVAVSAILEAAVVPQGLNAGNTNDPLPHRIISYLMPIVLGLARGSGEAQLLKQPMMQPTNPLKNEVVQTIFTNAKNYSTCVTNVRNIVVWQQQTQHDIYSNYLKLTVIIGERDDVLDNTSMLASAEEGAKLYPGLEILHTKKTNHFVSLEQPDYLHRLLD